MMDFRTVCAGEITLLNNNKTNKILAQKNAEVT